MLLSGALTSRFLAYFPPKQKQKPKEKDMNIVKERKALGVSQLELALGSGIGRFKLFMIEKGHQTASKEELEKIMTYLTQRSELSKRGHHEIKSN